MGGQLPVASVVGSGFRRVGRVLRRLWAANTFVPPGSSRHEQSSFIRFSNRLSRLVVWRGVCVRFRTTGDSVSFTGIIMSRDRVVYITHLVSRFVCFRWFATSST